MYVATYVRSLIWSTDLSHATFLTLVCVGNAVFHDAVKFWSCCADKKCYDFESFLAVPGCATGFHDDGVIDL